MSSTTPHWTLSLCTVRWPTLIHTHCFLPSSFSSCVSHKKLQGSPALGFTCEEEEEELCKRKREWGSLFTAISWLSEQLIMQRTIPLLCSLVWLFLLCFGPVCPSTVKHSKCRHDKHTQSHQRTHSTKKLCDPSFNNQTAGAITQVRQLFVGFSIAHYSFYIFVLHHLWGVLGTCCGAKQGQGINYFEIVLTPLKKGWSCSYFFFYFYGILNSILDVQTFT